MIPMSETALEVLYSSTHIAVDFGYSFYSYEVMLLAMMDDNSVADILEAHGADLTEVEENLQNYMDANYEKFNDQKIPAQFVSHLDRNRYIEESINTHKNTQNAVKEIGQAAQKIASAERAEEIEVDHLFLALLSTEAGEAYKILAKNGLNLEDVTEYLQKGQEF